jgi:hypothetical protein
MGAARVGQDGPDRTLTKPPHVYASHIDEESNYDGFFSDLIRRQFDSIAEGAL